MVNKMALKHDKALVWMWYYTKDFEMPIWKEANI